MLCAAPLLINMHIRDVSKSFNNNLCLSFQHNIPLPMLRGYPKPGISYVQFDYSSQWKRHGMSHTWLVGPVYSSPHLPYTCKEDFEPHQKQWMSLPTA